MSHAVSMALKNPLGQPVPVGQNGCECVRRVEREGGREGGREGKRGVGGGREG